MADGMRKVDGWKWLFRHPRRDEIIRFVTSTSVISVPGWIASDKNALSIQRDRKAIQALCRGESLREAGDLVSKTHEWVRHCKEVYLNFSETLFTKRLGLDLRSKAREVLTREVVAAFDRGEHTYSQVAKMLGDKVTLSHARYWVRRMRTIYQRIDQDLPERISVKREVRNAG